MSYETENWARLSPKRRDAYNRLRNARGLATLPPPAIDLYVAPPPRPLIAVDFADAELLAEQRAAMNRFDTALREGAEGFAIKGGRVEGLEVVELPNGMGYEGIAEGRRGTVHVTEGFSIRR
jgi:hypothetical protein